MCHYQNSYKYNKNWRTWCLTILLAVKLWFIYGEEISGYWGNQETTLKKGFWDRPWAKENQIWLKDRRVILTQTDLESRKSLSSFHKLRWEARYRRVISNQGKVGEGEKLEHTFYRKKSAKTKELNEERGDNWRSDV